MPTDLLGSNPVAPRNFDEEALSDIWRDVLGHEDFGCQDDFFDVGGDSLRAMEMLLSVHKRFHRLITIDNLVLAGSTIQALAGLIHDTAPQTVLRTLNPGAGSPHILAAHVYGGAVSDYLEFSHAIRAGIKVSGICADYSRRSRAISIQQKAREAIRHIPDDPERVLMGYSYGGPLAFEITHLLGTQDKLVLIDPMSPFHGRLRKRLISQLKTSLLPSRDLGRERAFPGDYLYDPIRLKTKAVLLVSCDTTHPENTAGWLSVLDGPVEHFKVPGKHRAMLSGANALEIASKVQDWLEV